MKVEANVTVALTIEQARALMHFLDDATTDLSFDEIAGWREAFDLCGLLMERVGEPEEVE